MIHLNNRSIKLLNKILICGLIITFLSSTFLLLELTTQNNINHIYFVSKKSKFPNMIHWNPPMHIFRTTVNTSNTFKSLHNFKEGRTIHYDAINTQGSVTTYKNNQDPYYAFDDDVIRNPIPQSHCRRTAWHRMHFLTCNSVHELSFRTLKVVNHGTYRLVSLLMVSNISIAVKTIRPTLKFQFDNYEYTRMDALVMERLTASPRITDIYGHCGTTVLTEVFESDLESLLVSGSGYNTKTTNATLLYEQHANSNLSKETKLQIALRMAESLADLHGYKEGIIVHDDVQLSQYLINTRGQLKLNDFNRAEIMLYDSISKQYCRYRNGNVFGNYRSPEEIQDLPLNQQIDVWSLGNNFYTLLTGLWIFYDLEDDTQVQQRLKDGDIAIIHDSFKKEDSVITQAILKCWEYNPDQRITVFELVNFFRKALNKLYEEKEKNKVKKEIQ